MTKDHFKNKSLGSLYCSIGQDINPIWATCEERNSHLRIYGGLAPNQPESANAIGRNINSYHISATTGLDINPSNQDADAKAGLLAFFDKDNWYYFYQTSGKHSGTKVLQISSFSDSNLNQIELSPIDLSNTDNLQLKISIEENKILFYYSEVKYQWHKVGASLSISSPQTKKIESKEEDKLNLGFVGMCVQCTAGHKSFADFEYFKFEDHDA